MRNRMQRFFMGRYGQDPLNQVLLIAALVLMVVSIFVPLLYPLALVPLILNLFRMLSRNIEKRSAEAMAFERFKGRIAAFFRGIKNRVAGGRTHRYYKCPSCKQKLRVPKGKGLVSINCPKCHVSFERKT